MRAGRPLFLFLIILLSGSATFGGIEVEPSDPTSSTPVTLTIKDHESCPPAVLTRSGFTISVSRRGGLCPGPPPTVFTQRFEVGLLPAGQYQVLIVTTSGQLLESGLFVVLDANDSVVVRPSVGSIGGARSVEVFANVNQCPRPPCPLPTIIFGGVEATDVVAIDSRTYRATTPPHAAGAVEVVVTNGFIGKSSYAFRYYDPTLPPLSAIFERILIPVTYKGPGALGSVWTTEIAVRNNNAYAVELWRPVDGLATIPPSRPISLSFDSAPGGLWLVVPREAAPALHVDALVRELSRHDREWGIEIPVVRENEFSQTIELLNIPIDPRFRHTLRIYASQPTRAGVVVYSMETGAPQLHGRSVSLEGEGQPFAVLDDVISPLRFTPGGRVGVRVSSASTPIWAFMTITNNETQHVTVRSPH